MDSAGDRVCFICLDDSPPLIRPCACRCLCCHQTCLARWQLQSAGREEENKCRFCKQTLPDWKAAFSDITDEAVPVMSIQFNDHTYWLEVKPGDGGVEQFKDDVRRLLGLGSDQSFDITFECRVPGADHSKMELQGLHAYDAAVYCASLTAARRISRSGNSSDDCRSTSSHKPNSATWSRSRSSSYSGSSTGGAVTTLEDAAAVGGVARYSMDDGAVARRNSSSGASSSSGGQARRNSSSSSSSITGSACSTVDVVMQDADAAAAAIQSSSTDAISSSSSSSGSSGFQMMHAAAARLLTSLKLLWQPPDDIMEFR